MSSRATTNLAEVERSKTSLPEEVQPSLKRSWGMLFLAIIEAVCVFSVAAARAGFVVGSSSAIFAGWSTFLHRDIFRIPILATAIAGAILNLYLLWKRHKLRNADAAAWRRRPITKRERWKTSLVLFLSILTLVTSAIEIYLHRSIHHTIM
ncbi:MAG TPA: hypothetical protein VNV88_00135 [Candidatus Solibacter sp.]|jgi:hypothetical protein|nr:hypothetical protein [Candidatus Solibacter sp.]